MCGVSGFGGVGGGCDGCVFSGGSGGDVSRGDCSVQWGCGELMVAVVEVITVATMVSL